MTLSKRKPNNLKRQGKFLLQWIEIFLGIIVLVAVIVMSIFTIIDLFSADWSSMDTFMELLKTILQLAIGVEIARLLFSYSVETIIELAVFVVARKLLLLEHDFIALILGIVSLVLLFGARHFFMEDDIRSSEILKKQEQENAS